MAGAIRELLETGRLATLERLRGEVNPVEVLTAVPGIGQELAERLHEQHDIGSLEDLEQTAHEGWLREVQGIGRSNLKDSCIEARTTLASILQQRPLSFCGCAH